MYQYFDVLPLSEKYFNTLYLFNGIFYRLLAQHWVGRPALAENLLKNYAILPHLSHITTRQRMICSSESDSNINNKLRQNKIFQIDMFYKTPKYTVCIYKIYIHLCVCVRACVYICVGVCKRLIKILPHGLLLRFLLVKR